MKRIRMNKNIFLKAALCIFTFSAMQPAQAFISEKAQGLSFAMTALMFAVLNEEIAESETFGKVAQFCNMDAQDLTSSLTFSSALWAASYIPEGSGRTVLRLCSIVPLLASACLPKKAITKLGQLPGIRHFFSLMQDAKGLPLIGDMVQCNQLDCQGLCHTCKARKMYLAVPFAAIPFIPTLYRSVNATIARWEQERIQSAQRPYFETLGIPVETVLTREIINNAFRAANLRIHPDQNPIPFERGTPEYDEENRNRADQINRIRTARDVLRAFLEQNNNQQNNTNVPNGGSTCADQPD